MQPRVGVSITRIAVFRLIGDSHANWVAIEAPLNNE